MGLSAATIVTDRLELTPLQVSDAEEMALALADERLHEFIGGRPATAEELRGRYSRMVAGSGRPDELWLNWVLRLDGTAIGYVQATVNGNPPDSSDVAWVVGVPWQGHGYATEAARALVDWLAAQGIARIEATIYPGHRASEGVAEAIGLTPTDGVVDGERVWRLDILD